MIVLEGRVFDNRTKGIMENTKIKHLEFIQEIVKRQADSTFKIKAWSVTILVALAGLSRASKDDIFVIGLGVVALFWILDAYYFSKERKFRALYNKVRKQKTTNLSMDISEFNNWKCSWIGCMFSIAVLVPYGAMLVGILLFKFFTE